jgi:hypothetical protein
MLVLIKSTLPLFRKVVQKIFLFNYTIIIDKDYKILFLPTEEQKKSNHGGNNKQTILLNIDIFSLFNIKEREKMIECNLRFPSRESD